MIESQHGVGLTATEVRLQLHYRIALLPAQSLHSPGKQALQASCQISAAEELRRLFVLVGSFTHVDLPQVCSKLGLLVAPARHVLMRSYYLAPRLQVASGLAFNGCTRGLALLAANLLIKAHA